MGNTQAILKKMRELINQPCWSKSWELYDELEQILTAQEGTRTHVTSPASYPTSVLQKELKRRNILTAQEVKLPKGKPSTMEDIVMEYPAPPKEGKYVGSCVDWEKE